LQESQRQDNLDSGVNRSQFLLDSFVFWTLYNGAFLVFVKFFGVSEGIGAAAVLPKKMSSEERHWKEDMRFFL